MIVCHCSGISDHEIRAAVEWMRASDPDTIVTPGKVYRALGKRVDCGGCMPLFLSTLKETPSFEVPAELRGLRRRQERNGIDEGRPRKVIEYLNAALRSELTAVSQYWLHYRLQEDWGFGRLADKSRAESIEEMHHADKLIERIIFLEGHPNLQKLDSLRIGQNIKETLEADLAGEHDARTLYIEARDHCEAVKDYVSKDLFEALITDEEGHIDFLETQLDLYETLGASGYALLQAKPANEAEG